MEKTTSPFTILFVHGYTASSKVDWYPAISQELDSLGVPYVIPDLPGGDYPKAEVWLETIHNVIKDIETPLVFVGHSLGTRTVLLYLEKYKPKTEKVFLIAAFRNDVIERVKPIRKERYGNFFTHVIDTESLRPLVGKFIVMHSTDDPDIPYTQGEEIAKELGATLKTYEGLDHMYEPRIADIVLKALREELHF